jgi:hypothetical protein
MSQARKKAHTRGTSTNHSVQSGLPLAAPEYQPLLKLLLEFTEMWDSAAKKLTTYAIDATENVVKGAIEGQRVASGWAKDTPVAPLLEEQPDITREFVVRSADLARRLWLLQLEQSEEAAEQAEEEMLAVTRTQA